MGVPEAPTAGFWAVSQRKANLVHLGLKIWH